jgi:hypothetical protein
MSDFNIYSSVFFWDFKRMDNVNYNFDIVETLIKASISYEPEDHREFFYKPIILIMTSIIECILYDFFIRIPGATQEGVPCLDERDIALIKDTNIPNKLASYIDICKKYKMLGKGTVLIYEELSSLAKKRNRIHIQNTNGSSPKDENRLWTTSSVKSCGKLLKDICLIMYNNYPRPNHIHGRDDLPHSFSFPEPWNLI